MILIQEIKNLSEDQLRDLAAEHHSFVNPSDINGYTVDSIYKKIESKRDYFVNQKNQAKSDYCNNDETKYQHQLRFLNLLLSAAGDYLKQIIIGKLAHLQNVVDHIEANYPIDLISVNDSVKAKLTPFGVVIRNLFDYGRYRDSALSREVSKKLGFDYCYCPYCNIKDLTVIETEGPDSHGNIEKALLYYDHFYPQSRCPYLSVSFYNLIRACHDCNSRFKYEKKFTNNTHFNPYEKAFEDHYEFKLAFPLLNLAADKEITIIPKNILFGQFGDATIVDLELVSRYKPYKKVIEGKIDFLKKNRSSHRESVGLQLFANPNSITWSELLSACEIPESRKDILNYPFGKAKRDICIHEGLIKII